MKRKQPEDERSTTVDTVPAPRISESVSGTVPPDGSTLELVDRYVGERVRARRLHLGLSQLEVAAALGIGYQQLHKYEHGTNRIGASRLFELAQLMNVHISYFFETIPEKVGVSVRKELSEYVETNRELRDELNELIANFFRITDPAVRRKILEFLRALESKSP